MAQQTLGGRYTIQEKIGTGGMAIVYRGLDSVLGRTVAIKTMLPQYAADPSFAARFKQEAQAAAALQSPYIVSVYDWGKDGDTYYIVMEYLSGTDLKSGIRNHGALSSRKVAQIGSQIAQALSVAHRHDIIHRDIKPQNIMVQPDGNIKVMDFGIARAKNSHLTQDNSVLGTAHYVSPEQTQGKQLGPTSDIYSLGIVMYEAATGKVPFEGDDAISVALKQVNEQPIPPSQINPTVDPALEAIILKCMAKDPAQRFQSAREVSRVLRDYLAGRVDAVANATTVMGAAPTSRLAKQDRTQAMPQVSAPLAATSKRGAVRPGNNPQNQADNPNKGSKKKVVFGVLAAIAALAIIGFAIFNVMNNNNQGRKVPNFYGLTKEQAVSQIESSNYFTVGDIKEEYSPHVEVGKVIDQNPSADAIATQGTAINLVISKGEAPAEEVAVPDLKGLTPTAAQDALTKAGLKFAVGDSVFSSEVDNGKVAQQSPKAGSKLKQGDTVTYQLSKGVESVGIPSVVGMSLRDAQKSLEGAGFTVKVTQSYSSTVTKGLVINQSDTGKANKGTEITINVSQGPEAPKNNESKDNKNNDKQDANNGEDASGKDEK